MRHLKKNKYMILMIAIISLLFIFRTNLQLYSYLNVPQMLVSTKKDKYDNIRLVAFGTSDTYGAGMSSDLNRESLTYPKLLSQGAKNYAIRASSPNYPRACAQSMISDEIFDVIVLEYFIRGYAGLIPLVKRLRERFPDSLIIILREWNPHMNVIVEEYIETNEMKGKKNTMTACGWIQKNNFDIYDHNQLKKAMDESKENDNIKWKWTKILDQDKINIQEKAANLFGAYILPMDRPDHPEDWIKYAHLFANDCHHKSAQGHEDVAKRIRQFIKWKGITKQPRVNEWGYHDSCVSWFESGDTSGIEYTKNIKLEKFANKNGPKFALSFFQNAGSITLTNPSKNYMALYLAYMTTGPGTSKYPKTEVQIIHASGDMAENNQPNIPYTITLDVQASNAWGNSGVDVHVQKLKEIGMIPPGQTILNFKALNKTQWPFRLVSVVVSRKDEEGYPNDGLTTIPGDNLNLFHT